VVAAIEFGDEMVGELVSALRVIDVHVLARGLGAMMLCTLIGPCVHFVIGTLICGLGGTVLCSPVNGVVSVLLGSVSALAGAVVSALFCFLLLLVDIVMAGKVVV
jgi:hypothetical protein